jgi:hypothetical protein
MSGRFTSQNPIRAALTENPSNVKLKWYVVADFDKNDLR